MYLILIVQMLNCCIDRKKAREERRKQQSSPTKDSNLPKTSLPSDQSDERVSPTGESSSSRGGAPSHEAVTRIVRAASSRSKDSDDSEDEFFECDDATPPDDAQEQSINSGVCREDDGKPSCTISFRPLELFDIVLTVYTTCIAPTEF